jgi:hypothetical protein
MQTRRLAGAALGLAAAATFSVAGCTASGDSATPGAGASAAASPSASAPGGTDAAAAATLARSTAQLGTTSFKVSMTSGTTLSMTGQMDPPNKVGSNSLEIKGSGGSLQVQTLLVDQDLYLKLGGVSGADKWMHVDVARLPEGANIGLRPGQIDPAKTEQLLNATTEVRQLDPRTFEGTLDLTKVTGLAGINQVTLNGYGELARSVPFQATLDEQGRLSTMTVDLPPVAGQKAQPLEISYSDYGAPLTVEKPAASQVTEAPEAVYKTLGG